MADRKRRGEDAVDDRLDVDDVTDETELDDEDLDEDLDDDDVDDDDTDDDEDEETGRSNGRSRRGTLTKDKSKRPAGRKATKVKSADRRPNIFMRFINFFREVVAELRKVIWPTRKELVTYSMVVVVFVALMLAIVGGLDWVYYKIVLWTFGNGIEPETE